jgi:5'-3' exonuclease
MKIRTLLVDSSYLLKRSFNGAKDVHTHKFGHIGGLYSFLTTVRKLIKAHKINKVVLVWDGQNGGVDRHQIDAAYKSNRKNKSWHQKIELSEAEIKREAEKEESILKQRQRIKAYAEELFLRQIEIDDIEADDLIAAYCMQYERKEEIYVYTNDRDFSQLLDLNITILFANIDMPITKANYSLQFGHHYTNALIMKVITGDKADMVQGIKGIGEDTLIKYFPDMRYKKYTVREICKEADKINKERVANGEKPLKVFENLLSHVDRLIMNYKLVNLREPFLNAEAREALLQLDAPLDPTDRGSRNLIKMMNEDEFLTIYTGTFPNYVEPFYVVIEHEKELLTEYNKNNKPKL